MATMEIVDVRNVRYRLTAKVVGFCDTAFSCGAAIFYILVMNALARPVGIHESTAKETQSEFEWYPDSDISARLSDHFVRYMYVSTTMHLVVTIFQISWAIMLITATSTWRTPRSSQKLVQLYIFFDGGVLLVYLAWRIVDQQWGGLVLWGLLRFASLCIAGLYLGKLRHITMTNQQSKVEAGRAATGKIAPVSSLGTDTEETVD